MQHLFPVIGVEVEGEKEGMRPMLAVERLHEAASRSSRAGGGEGVRRQTGRTWKRAHRTAL